MHGKGKNQNRVTITNQVPREKKILKKNTIVFQIRERIFKQKLHCMRHSIEHHVGQDE